MEQFESDQESEHNTFKEELSGKMTGQDLSVAEDSLLDNFNVKKQLFQLFILLKDRRWIATVRSPVSFFHMKEFGLPSSRNDLQTRITSNSNYFLTNYVILLLLMLSYSILTRPYLLIFMALVVYLWLVVVKKGDIHITENVKIGGKMKYALFFSLTALFWLLLAGKIIAVVFSTFFVLVLAHVVFHKTITANNTESSYNELAVDAV